MKVSESRKLLDDQLFFRPILNILESIELLLFHIRPEIFVNTENALSENPGGH